MNTIDPVLLNKVKYHIDSLKHILEKNNLQIVVSKSSGTANLMTKDFSVTHDSMIQEDQETFMDDDFEHVDLPISLYDPEIESFAKNPD